MRTLALTTTAPLSEDKTRPIDCQNVVGVGDRVGGRYTLDALLGAGGMGVVFLATDTYAPPGSLPSEAQVAIKVLRSLHSEADAARLEREALIGAILPPQPGLVTAYDSGTLANGGLFLVMDAVLEAKTLDLSTGSLVERVRSIRTAAALVRRLHRAGILHRDVKPENFLVSPDGGMHLADFGIAKQISVAAHAEPVAPLPTLTAEFSGLGTSYYMPLEQFEDAKSVDRRADVFALGVMLFRALTGRYPYGDGTPNAVYTNLLIAHETRVLPSVRSHHPEGTAELDALVQQAIAPRAAQRLPSATGFLLALDAIDWITQLAGVQPLAGAPPQDGTTVKLRGSTRGSTQGGSSIAKPVDPDLLNALGRMRERKHGSGSTTRQAGSSPPAVPERGEASDPILRATQRRLRRRREQIRRDRRAQVQADLRSLLPLPPPPAAHDPERTWSALTVVGLLLLVVATVLFLWPPL